MKKNRKLSEADVLFQSSAKLMKNRVNPIDCITGFEPKKKETILEKLRINYEKFISYLYKKNNEIRISRLDSISLKNESLNMYSNYYKYLYISKSANHRELLNLLSLYDSPDFENPASKNSVEHNYYHDCGFIAAEIQAILSFMLLKNERKNFEADEDIIKIVDEEDSFEKAKYYFEQAIISLSYIFYYGNKFEKLKKNIHNDNIEMAIIEIILNVDFDVLPFDKNKFIEILNDKGLIKKENVLFILNLKNKKILEL